MLILENLYLHNFTKGLSIVHNIHVFVKAIFTCFIVAS